jgi:hypothetical protein
MKQNAVQTNGFRIFTPRIVWLELRSSLKTVEQPADDAAARIKESQNDN